MQWHLSKFQHILIFCVKIFIFYCNEQAKDLYESFQNLYEDPWKFRLFKDDRDSKIFI